MSSPRRRPAAEARPTVYIVRALAPRARARCKGPPLVGDHVQPHAMRTWHVHMACARGACGMPHLVGDHKHMACAHACGMPHLVSDHVHMARAHACSMRVAGLTWSVIMCSSFFIFARSMFAAAGAASPPSPSATASYPFAPDLVRDAERMWLIACERGSAYGELRTSSVRAPCELRTSSG